MDKIKVGMVGLGGRGEVNMPRLLMFPDVEITVVCDVYEDRCHNMIKLIEEKGHKAPDFTLDYKEMIARADVDVVCIFSSWESHVEIALESMRKGKITAVEVGGAASVQECWDLVNTYEETKTPIMLLENCCYGRAELLVRNMVRAGLFGEIVHCHGAYAHDLRRQVSAGKEERHYRQNHYLNRNCDNYPTHDFGPIAKIIDINRGNRMVSLVSMASKARGMEQYINDRKETIVNRDLIGKSFQQGDIVKTLITCENGEMVSLTLDTTLPRFYSREFTVRGTKGLYEENGNTVFLDGDSHDDYVAVDYLKRELDNATKFLLEYLHFLYQT